MARSNIKAVFENDVQTVWNVITDVTSTLRKFAKKLDKSNELAFELWNTHYHEARLLAVLIFDHKCLSYDQIDTLMSEVLSWDLCDHLCKNLIIKLDYYEDFIFNWIAADHIYKKRASFVLIAEITNFKPPFSF